MNIIHLLAKIKKMLLSSKKLLHTLVRFELNIHGIKILQDKGCKQLTKVQGLEIAY